MTSLDLHASTELLRLLGDPSRLRLLSVLAEEELTVAELTKVTRLSQSRVSSHLGKLRDAGLVVDRPAGASSFHRLNEDGMSGAASRAWRMLRETTDDPLLEEDRGRLDETLAARNGAQTWADSVAGRMDRHYSPGRTWEATAWGLLGFARLGDVLDVASGDGVLAQLLAPRARTVTCLDRSARVTEAGRRRLEDLPHVRFRRGDMHALPFRDGVFDQVLLMNALTYTDDPGRVFREVARVLRDGGELAVSTLRRHRHEDAVRRYNHVNLGHDPDALREGIEAAGLDVALCDVTARERQKPYFEIITVHAAKGADDRPDRGDR